MDNLKRNAESDSEDEMMQNSKRRCLDDKINLGEKRDQVIYIIKREFQNEITKRKDEIKLIQQRLLKAQKTLHLLKYVMVKSIYGRNELKINNSEERAHENRIVQSRIHPAIKKLLGKKPKETVGYDFARTRGQQNISPLYITQQNESPEIEVAKEIKQEKPDTLDRALDIENIKETEVLIRNRQKIKHEIIIGNISKYISSNNPQDNSTHKWMVYVRGPRDNPDINHFVKKVRLFLHPSYQPNDIVDLEEPPFHLTRRGWGEFPLRVQIYFQNTLNKPVDVIHNLKLDLHQTGRQTLGNETLIHFWLHDNSNLEENEINTEETNSIDENSTKEQANVKEEVLNIKEESLDIKDEVLDIKEEVLDIPEDFEENYYENSESALEFQESKPSCSKYNFYCDSIIEPKEDPDNINIKFEPTDKDNHFVHLVDHCYTEVPIDESILLYSYSEIIDREKYKFTIPVNNFNSIRQIVYFLFKSLPLVTKLAKDLSYTCLYTYVASTLEEFSSWTYAKRCCAEWYRAKHIKKMLQDNKIPENEEWTIKFIIMFGRAHGFTPLANYTIFQDKFAEKTLPNLTTENVNKSSYTQYIPIAPLMEDPSLKKIKEEEEIFIDVENDIEDVKEEKPEKKVILKSSETDPDLLPLCNYIKNCAGELNINLQDEEIAPNIFHNSSERVLLQSVMCLAEELIRSAWANKVIGRKGRNLGRIERHDIFKVLLEREEFDIFTNEGLGKIS